jgi:alpha-L-fucosidase
MKKLIYSVFLLVILTSFNIENRESSSVRESLQNDSLRAKAISDMEIGMFICWSFSTFYGQEWTPTLDKDASYFQATGCDTDQWCKVAKDAGMGYILFLSKHHDGFCLWDTKTTGKKVTNSPLGMDVLAQLRKSCDTYGIKLALYFSEGDWNWPGAVDGKGHQQGMGVNPEMKKAQLKELCTEYGPIEFFWMDHAVGDGGLNHRETVEWVHRFQPDCFVGFNHGEAAGRLSLRERGTPGPLGDANATMYNKEAEANYKGYLVAEFTYPILPAHEGGADWFYSLPEHDSLVHPVEKLFQDYQGAVKYRNIFSVNVGPGYAGRIREVDVETLQKLGELIRNSRSGFDWLVGSWKRTNDQEGSSTYEHWVKNSNTEYAGLGCTLQEGDTVFKEQLKLYETGGSWNLEVRGVNESPTVFLLINQAKGSFRAENKENDFPKQIEYSMADRLLSARISGGDSEITFLFERMQVK